MKVFSHNLLLLGILVSVALASPFENQLDFKALGRIDELVQARWNDLGLKPANPCSDAAFVRRAFLDVTGTLPSEMEAKAFLDNNDPGKHALLISQLLGRDTYADYWAMRWSDLLRVKAEFPINLWPNAAQAYHRWIRTAVRDNMPYDRFARELLVSSGSNFRDAPVNFYRALQAKDPKTIAQSVALVFLGQRVELWPTERLEGLAAFFSQVAYKSTSEWKEEIVYWDSFKIAGLTSKNAVTPDGKVFVLGAERDPRAIFADWLTAPGNPWFSRVAVNRLWAWLFGAGLVQEPDDFRADNPASNPALLDYLAAEFERSHYNQKHLMRLILESQTYRLSCLPNSDKPEGLVNFAAYAVRRLDAEVLADAINKITGTTEHYESAIPEPYSFVPDNLRSIALPDGSISSSFLELFGRPSRDTGQFAERNNKVTPLQRLHLLNSSHIRQKLERGPALQTLLREAKDSRGLVDRLYLRIPPRYPDARDLAAPRVFSADPKHNNR